MAAPERLSKPALAAIESGELVPSVATYWLLGSERKVQQGATQHRRSSVWWRLATEAMGARVLSIRAHHVAAPHGLPHHHRDPFDRILIAQAMTEGLVLVTSDDCIHRYAWTFAGEAQPGQKPRQWVSWRSADGRARANRGGRTCRGAGRYVHRCGRRRSRVGLAAGSRAARLNGNRRSKRAPN